MLSGWKTYMIAAMGGIYLLGVYAGFWTYDEKLLTGLGFGGLAALRAGVKTAEEKSSLQ